MKKDFASVYMFHSRIMKKDDIVGYTFISDYYDT